MNIGYRIKYLRKLKGLTQKELGLKLGFPEKAADVRIAQYESGSRVPKEDVVNSLANALSVTPKALTVPNIESIDEVVQILFAVEDECQLETLFKKDEIMKFFSVWEEKRQQLLSGSISKKEYDFWRYNYSIFEDI